MKGCTRALAAGAVGVFVLPSAAAQYAPAQEAVREYVVVGTHELNIRTGPGTDRLIICRADKGDLFLYAGEVGDWHEIEMFSGERRWVSKRYSYHITQLVPGHNMRVPGTDSTRRALSASIRFALERAAHEAAEIIPASADAERHAVLRRILEDRHVLEMMHDYGVQPALYGDLRREANERGW
jgi:SH3-like domain-containing protein